MKVRSRRILSAAERGGKPCPALDDRSSCNDHVCPADCVESAWSTWSACTRTCAGGTQTRVRSVVLAEQFGGKHCSGHLQQARHCQLTPCPVHCRVTRWSDWSPCTKTCGGGQSNRARAIKVHAEYGGYVCPALSQVRACNENSCPVDCAVSPFSAWSTCTRSCGGGSQNQHRVVEMQPAHGGVACPSLYHERICNTHECPVDCITSEWADWSACSATCAAGVQQRSRNITRAAGFGGVVCSALSATRPCDEGPCPVHCAVSAWSHWSTCSVSCGGAQQQRVRTIVRHFAHGGFQCPNLRDSRACNEHPCPVNCELSEFGAWSDCTRTCGGGQSRRQRSMLAPATHGGSCAALEEYTACNTDPCPQDCAVTAWGRWTTCSRTCSVHGDGEGKQQRTRQILVVPEHGGRACPVLKQLRPCANVPCGCSHVSCEYKLHEIHLKHSIRVSHSIQELFGSKHTCKWTDGKCRCTCTDFDPEHFKLEFRGQHWDDDDWKMRARS